MSSFLPASREEMNARGWDWVDVILVTGDAYVDHPSFGVALIGRWLESHGYRVAVISQPRYDCVDDFKMFGPPRLFWGISSGNLDSIVSNYTGNARVRTKDVYSDEGNPYFGDLQDKKMRRRPDRAVITYSNLARQAWKGVPVVIGGIEASLRRFVHYDYQQEKLRASILADSKADLLVYGMGERAVLEIARRIEGGVGLDEIPGTCQRISSDDYLKKNSTQDCLFLPSWDEIKADRGLFLTAELEIDSYSRALSLKKVVQRQQALWVVQNPSAKRLTTEELDSVYSLPFTRRPHPSYVDVPAFRMIEHSITAVRGCYGNCSFCAITRHQGPVVISRSRESVLKEVEVISGVKGFKGVISDIGGPTANMYGTFCRIEGRCKRHDCLFPNICRHLNVDGSSFERLLEDVSNMSAVRHVFVSSGLRMDLLLKTPGLLKRIIEKHQPGAMKIAPEHTSDKVLRLMHKPTSDVLEKFLNEARRIVKGSGKKARFVPYIISAHPGCEMKDMKILKRDLKRLGLTARQSQDFTPTPGTISTAMYVTGLDRYIGEKIYVPRKRVERREQRKMITQG